MEWKWLATVFITVLLAEMGDKTQLATMLYAADNLDKRLLIFLAASAALIVASAIGVFAGGLLGRWIDPSTLKWVAGLGFIAVGIVTLLSHP